MNVAVCVSGLARDGYKECIKRFKEIFPYDFYFMHWNGYEKPDIEDCIYFDEPPNHYHCMFNTEYKPDDKRYRLLSKLANHGMKTKNDFFKKTKNWHKQLLAHELLVNSLNKNYDLIIKLRYDVLIHVSNFSRALFREMEKKVFNHDITVGFADNKYLQLDDNIHIHEFYDCPKCQGYTLLDYIIIHKPSKLKNVMELYKNSNLLGAEWGAHQIFCQQWNQQFSFLNIRGGCLLFRDYK